MHLQVLVDQLARRHRRGTTARPESCEHLLKSLQRLSATREPAHLQPRRAASLQPVAVRPQRLPIRAPRLQLEHLPLLDHLEPPRSTTDRGVSSREAGDHPSQWEGVRRRSSARARCSRSTSRIGRARKPEPPRACVSCWAQRSWSRNSTTTASQGRSGARVPILSPIEERDDVVWGHDVRPRSLVSLRTARRWPRGRRRCFYPRGLRGR